MTRIPVAIAVGVALFTAGCSSMPSSNRWTDSPAVIRAVSLPESLVAGDSVTVFTQLEGDYCGMEFLGFRAIPVSSSLTIVQPWMRTHTGVVCVLGVDVGSSVFPYTTVVP